MKLGIFAFGKLKTPGLRQAADYYRGLIRPHVTMEEVELRPVPVPDKNANTRRQIQEKESAILTERLGSVLGSRGIFYLLDEGGQGLPTRSWAAMVRDWEQSGIPHVAFCVGSSLGFDDQLRRRARKVISLGPQTLPHELARVVLLEQLYRAWSVTRGHPYHNEGA
ncbi:MAG TPA: 23S rRNA (pseudouridine(1915)-N(3))-methyltransferase RlmH [Bdellovibrionota bacterium]|nr:23S rRNA (pseudouridine(1915)-N(3))-methyltransferase RlmH [Bdellovibrionota bacterium]